MSALGGLILLATGREVTLLISGQSLQSNQDGFPIKLLNCFSMLSNNNKILSTTSVVVDNLACLNGIRVLSTTWIVLYHSYDKANYSPMYNKFSMIEVIKENEIILNYLNLILSFIKYNLKDLSTWLLHGALNATIAVDTFFVMTAVLVTCSLMRELDRNNGRFNIGLFYLHRYLRL